MVVRVFTGTRYDRFLTPKVKGLILSYIPDDSIPHVGDCPTGVDNWVKQCAHMYAEYTADWEQDGKAAGPIRNKHMLEGAQKWAKESGLEIEVIAFPAGKSPGTRNCIKQATALGLTVIVHELVETIND